MKILIVLAILGFVFWLGRLSVKREQIPPRRPDNREEGEIIDVEIED